jgi:hypothetical protein
METMSDAPKIVKDRLRAAAPREAHPDADILTAFAEQALSGAEREGVMRHLARCGDCREVVALSIPPSVEAVAQPDRVGDVSAPENETRRAWLAWPQLRWAAMAAGVAVVASVLILRPEKQSETTIAVAPPALSLQSQAPSALSDDKSLASSGIGQAQAGAIKSDSAGSKLRDEKRAANLDEPMHTRSSARTASAPLTPTAGLHSFDSVGNSQGGKSSNDQQGDQLRMQARAAPAAVGGGAAGLNQNYGNQADSTNGAPGELQSAGKLIARNDAPALPIEKAKPAAKEEAELKSPVQENKLAGTSMLASTELDSNLARAKKQSKLSKNAIPQWSLAQGGLQRSLDAGSSWQIVLQLPQPLLSFGAFGNEVWAGGQTGVLAHSTNGGAAWTMIHPVMKTEALTSDIVSIEVRSATEIVLSTSDHESWTTTDAGVTWRKK